MTQVNINELTVDQLKAFKCDHYEEITRLNRQVSILNSELQKRDLEARQKLIDDSDTKPSVKKPKAN